MDIAPVILAGGFSKRFQLYKPIFNYKGKPLIYHVISKLVKVFPKVYISVKNFEQIKLIEKVLSRDVSFEFIIDDFEIQHPVVGIYSAAKNLVNKSDYMFVIACDLPEITKESIEFIVKIVKEVRYFDAIIPRWRNMDYIEPLFAVYNIRRTYELCNQLIKVNDLNKVSIRDFIKKLNNVIYLSAEEMVKLFGPVFTNINSIEDLR